MRPVNVNGLDTIGMVAASQIAFGAAVIYAADKTIKSTLNTVDNVLGIAKEDLMEKDIDGFYSQYDEVPLVPVGRTRMWVTPNYDAAEDIEAGDYLEVAILGGGSNTLPVGVLQEMGAESGTGTGAVKELRSVAKALESMDLLDIEPVASDVAVGATTVTMSSANMTNLDLDDGDYILLEDISGNCMINRVDSTTSTVITLQIASTVALASGDSDPIHKLAQVEAILI